MVLLPSFIKKPKNTSYDGEDSDEHIIYIFRGSFIPNLGWIFSSLVGLSVPFFISLFYPGPQGPLITPRFAASIMMFWYLVVIGLTFHRFLIWFFNVYIVTDKKIVDIDFHGLLYKNITEAPLRNIEDVTSKIKGALRVIFNYGYVYIQTSADQREIEFEDVDNPSRVRDLVSDFIEKYRNGH